MSTSTIDEIRAELAEMDAQAWRDYYSDHLWAPGARDAVRHLLAALDAAQARADALADMLELVCVEFEGTHEHLQDIIDGNVTGVLAPIENYKRLKHDLAEMRQMDERAIAAARELMGGDV